MSLRQRTFLLLILSGTLAFHEIRAKANPDTPTNAQISEETSLKRPAEFEQRLQAISAEVPPVWWTRFPNRTSVPVKHQENLTRLMEEMIEWLSQSPPTEIHEKHFATWSQTMKQAFSLRIMLDWQQLDPALKQFQQLELLLSQKASHLQRTSRAKLLASLADPILRLWLGPTSSRLLPWMAEIEKRHLADENNRLPVGWLRDRCTYALLLISRQKNYQNTLQATVRSWMTAYLTDSTSPETNRAAALARYCIQLHTLGQANEALHALNWWQAQAPESAKSDIRFLHAKFFVQQIGLADRQSAREVLLRLDELVESGNLSPDDDRFRIITQNYYRYLQFSDLEHAALSHQLVQAQNTDTPQ